MPIYKVLVAIDMKVHVTVDAKSEDDAQKKVENMDESQILKGDVNDVSSINIIAVTK